MLFQVEETDSFSFERKLAGKSGRLVGGVDEAGRGPLAGPVVAACVVLPLDCDYTVFRDSKKLTAQVRRKLYDLLQRMDAQIGVGIRSAEEIDRINILQASLLAMKQAMESLPRQPDFLLVDGKHQVPVAVSQCALVKGESRSASIAAASIVAKVVRDELMEQYHQQYPMYNFQKHKGYPTVEHRECIKKYGPCPIHRQTFKGVREFVEQAAVSSPTPASFSSVL